MIVAGLVGLLASFAALRSADDRVEVAVAAHDLRAGTTVHPSDFTYARVAADSDLLGRLVQRDHRAALEEVVVNSTLRAGEVIRRSELRERASRDGRRAMSIPVARARAVNGRIVTGDRVDVIVVSEHESAIVIAGAEVLDVATPGAGALGSVGDELGITLSVDAHQSQILAAAAAADEVFLARATGARSAIGIPPVDLTADGTKP
jgi:Flp pilus assembly protein CpaB